MDASELESDENIYGNFNLIWNDEPYITTFLKTDEDDDLLGSMDFLCSTPPDTTISLTLNSITQQSAITDLPPPEIPVLPQTHIRHGISSLTTMPTEPRSDVIESNVSQPLTATDMPPERLQTLSSSRFSFADKSTIDYFEGLTQADATKCNTDWGIKVLQEWHTAVYGEPLDLISSPPAETSEKLRKFYCEVRTKKGELYHKNTLKNLRAAINRYLQDNNIDFDIVRDKTFKSSNKVLNGFMKNMTKKGQAKPTKHYKQISANDLKQINQYFKSNVLLSPIVLRHCVWFLLSFQFVSRGLEFHNQLSINSLDFNTDGNELEYVTLSHKTQEKNFQGGLYSDDFHRDKRMYETGDDLCPVKMLKLLISKTNPEARSLFNSITPQGNKFPQMAEIYSNEPLEKRTFSGFMPDITKNAQCTEKYTAHCLRATAISGLSDAGFEARHIMYMSGHRNEASMRSYNRNQSEHQKHTLSHTLSAVATGDHSYLPITPNHTGTILSSSNNSVSDNFTTSFDSNTETNPVAQHLVMSKTSSSSGLLNNSTFSSCTFNIVMEK